MAASGVASRLILLPDLSAAKLGDKVRFLGCVESYDIKSANLTLGYSYQSTQSRRHKRYFAEVDISPLLEDVKSIDLQIGAWINIVGYVGEARAVKSENKRKHSTEDRPSPRVQAIMLWNAEEIRLDQYEQAVKMRNAI